MNKQKTRPSKTLKCSQSKTIRHRMLKSSHHVDLIRSTWCELLSFLGLIVLNLEHFKVLRGLVLYLFTLYISIMHLSCKSYLCTIYVAKFESFARKCLLSRKYKTFLPLGSTWLQMGPNCSTWLQMSPKSQMAYPHFVYKLLTPPSPLSMLADFIIIL